MLIHWRQVFSRTRLRSALLNLALILGVLGAVHLYQTHQLPVGSAPPLAGPGSDGSLIKLGAGGTATLVAFWADWCPVCAAEEGNIVAVAQDYPVVSVAMQSGNAAAVRQHLQQRQITLPALIDEDGRHAQNWQVRGVPTHFIVDAAGNIRFRTVGYTTTWGLKARLWWAGRFPA